MRVGKGEELGLVGRALYWYSERWMFQFDNTRIRREKSEQVGTRYAGRKGRRVIESAQPRVRRSAISTNLKQAMQLQQNSNTLFVVPVANIYKAQKDEAGAGLALSFLNM